MTRGVTCGGKSGDSGSGSGGCRGGDRGWLRGRTDVVDSGGGRDLGGGVAVGDQHGREGAAAYGLGEGCLQGHGGGIEGAHCVLHTHSGEQSSLNGVYAGDGHSACRHPECVSNCRSKR